MNALFEGKYLLGCLCIDMNLVTGSYNYYYNDTDMHAHVMHACNMCI